MEALTAECARKEKKGNSQSSKINELEQQRGVLEGEIVKAKKGIENYEVELKNAEKEGPFLSTV